MFKFSHPALSVGLSRRCRPFSVELYYSQRRVAYLWSDPTHRPLSAAHPARNFVSFPCLTDCPRIVLSCSRTTLLVPTSSNLLTPQTTNLFNLSRLSSLSTVLHRSKAVHISNLPRSRVHLIPQLYITNSYAARYRLIYNQILRALTALVYPSFSLSEEVLRSVRGAIRRCNSYPFVANSPRFASPRRRHRHPARTFRVGRRRSWITGTARNRRKGSCTRSMFGHGFPSANRNYASTLQKPKLSLLVRTTEASFGGFSPH